MAILDDPDQIKKLDSHNMLGSLFALDEQLKTAWESSKKITLASDREIRNIVFAGMGGSSLGADFVRSVFDPTLPMQIVKDYKLPSFVDKNSLVIAASYSGQTEETLSALKDALDKQALVVGIASGGPLIDILKEKKLPFYQIDPRYNPSGQPRMGTGYTIGALVGFLTTLNLVSFSQVDLEKISNHMMALHDLGIDNKTAENPAKTLATSLVGKVPIIVAAEFLAGNAHIFANQINENAKTFSAYFLLSEMNHHLLEGTMFPGRLSEIIKFVFLETPLYGEKIKTRLKITRDLLSSSNIESISYNVKGSDKLTAAFEALVFSSWASFYLAIANGQDPSPIPNVDFFKKQLAKLA